MAATRRSVYWMGCWMGCWMWCWLVRSVGRWMQREAMRYGAIGCAILLALLPLTSDAQESGAAGDDDKGFDFSSDTTTVIFSEGRERTTLSGNATVRSKSTSLVADYIEVYGEDFRFVQCTGNVEVTDDEEGYRLTTDSLFFDRELEIIRGRGNNVMEDFDNEIVVKGEFLEHRNIENRSEIQVGTRILGEDITATAEFVRYQRDTQILEFSGLPLVRWKGDQYQAARIVVDMDDDSVSLQGQVYGEIEIENDDPPEEDVPVEEGAEEEESTEESTEDTSVEESEEGEDDVSSEEASDTDESAEIEDEPSTPSEEAAENESNTPSEEGADESLQPAAPSDEPAENEPVEESSQTTGTESSTENGAEELLEEAEGDASEALPDEVPPEETAGEGAPQRDAPAPDQEAQSERVASSQSFIPAISARKIRERA